MKNTYILTLACISALGLSACTSTWEGLKSDFGTFGSKVSETSSELATKAKTTTLNAKTATQNKVASLRSSNPLCPPLTVNPALDSITEFYDPAKTDDSQIVSTLRLTSTEATCERNGDLVAMEINLNFDGQTGPKATRKDGDKPFFSYPYYIAVKDLDGVELSKEIFAAGITYNSDQSAVLHKETIRQRLPLKNGKAPYIIETGFQLSPEQLAYNAKQENQITTSKVESE